MPCSTAVQLSIGHIATTEPLVLVPNLYRVCCLNLDQEDMAGKVVAFHDTAEGDLQAPINIRMTESDLDKY